jgi:ribonuclease P protein component
VSPELVIITVRSSGKSNKSSNLPDKLADRARLGITVSRKVGNAVVRNRFKRRTREWFRSQRSLLNPEIDLVVIARRPGGRMSFSELDACLSGLLEIPPLIGPSLSADTIEVSPN